MVDLVWIREEIANNSPFLVDSPGRVQKPFLILQGSPDTTVERVSRLALPLHLREIRPPAENPRQRCLPAAHAGNHSQSLGSREKNWPV